MPPRQRTSEYDAARQRKPLQISIHIDGLDQTLRALRGMPKEASAALRDRAGLIAADMVGWVQARAFTPQQDRVADTAKVVRDRVPAIQLGGTKRITRTRTPAWKILFGANFGARRFPQFLPWAGRGRDYFIWAAVEAHEAQIERRWLEAVDETVAAFGAGG